MTRRNNFSFKIGDRNLEKYSLAPNDTLGELSDFELGLRRFCYEYDHAPQVYVIMVILPRPD